MTPEFGISVRADAGGERPRQNRASAEPWLAEASVHRAPTSLIVSSHQPSAPFPAIVVEPHADGIGDPQPGSVGAASEVSGGRRGWSRCLLPHPSVITRVCGFRKAF